MGNFTFMHHTILVVTVKMVKVDVHLWKLLQNLNKVITFLDHPV